MILLINVDFLSKKTTFDANNWIIYKLSDLKRFVKYNYFG